MRAFEAVKWDALLAYGGKCKFCEESKMEFLTIERVDGCATAQSDEEAARVESVLKRVPSSDAIWYYGWLRMKGYPKGYQILCMRCRLAREVYGYCPHPIIGREE